MLRLGIPAPKCPCSIFRRSARTCHLGHSFFTQLVYRFFQNGAPIRPPISVDLSLRFCAFRSVDVRSGRSVSIFHTNRCMNASSSSRESFSSPWSSAHNPCIRVPISFISNYSSIPAGGKILAAARFVVGKLCLTNKVLLSIWKSRVHGQIEATAVEKNALCSCWASSYIRILLIKRISFALFAANTEFTVLLCAGIMPLRWTSENVTDPRLIVASIMDKR